MLGAWCLHVGYRLRLTRAGPRPRSARLFGPAASASAYGETPFSSWRAVIERPAVAAALGLSGSPAGVAARGQGGEGGQGRWQPRAVVLGSALGYLCLYFRAAGVPCCVGVDLLAGAMAAAPTAVLLKHGLGTGRSGIELLPGDALTAELNGGGGGGGADPDTDHGANRANSTTMTTVIWLNDEAWSPGVRAAALRRAATALPPGGAVVSYGTASTLLAPSGLRLAERVVAPTSWCTDEQFRIYTRV